MATRRQVAEAFAARTSARCHNATTDGVEYLLHGHKIAERITPTVFRFNWCGWYTPTTAAHMNDILRAIGSGLRVSYTAARDGKADSVFDVQPGGE